MAKKAKDPPKKGAGLAKLKALMMEKFKKKSGQG